MTRANILAAVWLLSLLAAFGAGREWRDRSCELAEAKGHIVDANNMVKAVEQARAVEQSKSAAMAEIGEKHELDRQAAEGISDSVVADLRAGNVRLRQEWAGCETRLLSQAVASTVERDALAASREEAAGRIVRIGRDADDQLRACQAVVMTDRQ